MKQQKAILVERATHRTKYDVMIDSLSVGHSFCRTLRGIAQFRFTVLRQWLELNLI
jgi:hypothetical protein